MNKTVTYSAVLSWCEIVSHLDVDFKIELAKTLHYSLQELSSAPILTTSSDKDCVDVFHIVEV